MTKKTYSTSQLTGLVLLRVAIGWHFLYEGIIKIINPNWSSFGYLMDSKGFMENFFHAIAQQEQILYIADLLNMWGLAAIGLSLILGLLTRPAIIGGIILLAMYYLSHPAFLGLGYALPSEGNYFIINKTLVELFALYVLWLFPTSKIIGLDRLIFGSSSSK
ncbi:MAG: DoxX family membrane protein [Bacteroidales bacterium]|nr:DoxX family membrane protein [Bacteroidales bacterium]